MLYLQSFINKSTKNIPSKKHFKRTNNLCGLNLIKNRVDRELPNILSRYLMQLGQYA